MNRADIRKLRPGGCILNLSGDGSEHRIVEVRRLPDSPHGGRASALLTVEYGRGEVQTCVTEGGPEMLSDAPGGAT